jgi:hypothetical protein
MWNWLIGVIVGVSSLLVLLLASRRLLGKRNQGANQAASATPGDADADDWEQALDAELLEVD